MKGFFKRMVCLFSLCFVAHAEAGPQHEHNHKHDHSHKRQAGKHVHGEAVLALAAEGKKGSLEFNAPLESLLGFEHEARTEAEKKALNDLLLDFKELPLKWIQFDGDSACSLTPKEVGLLRDGKVHDGSLEKTTSVGAQAKAQMDEKAEKAKHGEHADFVARYDLICQKDLEGQRVTLDFLKYKRIKELEVLIVVGETQKAIKLKKLAANIDLK